MLRIGLTGGIGSGKSTVAARFAELGAVVIDADQLARDAVAPGTDGLAEVVRAFGEQFLRPDGALDRRKLGEYAFGDQEARQRLNAIVHPRVRGLTAKEMAAAPEGSVVVHDVPLLLENGMRADYHLVIAVVADVPRRLEWLRERRLSVAQVEARIATQVADEQRHREADIVIDNNGSVTDLFGHIDRLWKQRVQPFRENLKAARPAAMPADVLPYDSVWPARYQRLESRLVDALGEYLVTIEHVGATAVPGTRASGIIDIRLWVKGRDMNQIALALGERGWFPMGVAWRVPRFGFADPGNPARVYVHMALRR